MHNPLHAHLLALSHIYIYVCVFNLALCCIGTACHCQPLLLSLFMSLMSTITVSIALRFGGGGGAAAAVVLLNALGCRLMY